MIVLCCWGRLLEQGVGQTLQSTLLVRLLNQEGDVVVASAVTDHANGNVAHGIGGNGLKAEVAPIEVAHNADNAHVGVDGNGSILLQFVDNLVKMRMVVDAHGNAHLRRGQHVNGGLVALEDLKKSMMLCGHPNYEAEISRFMDNVEKMKGVVLDNENDAAQKAEQKRTA